MNGNKILAAVLIGAVLIALSVSVLAGYALIYGSVL